MGSYDAGKYIPNTCVQLCRTGKTRQGYPLTVTRLNFVGSIATDLGVTLLVLG